MKESNELNEYRPHFKKSVSTQLQSTVASRKVKDLQSFPRLSHFPWMPGNCRYKKRDVLCLEGRLCDVQGWPDFSMLVMSTVPKVVLGGSL